MFLSSGCWINVGSPLKRCESVTKIWTPQKVRKSVIMLKLTFHLESDWLRLYAPSVNIQSAAVLPCIGPLHGVNAEIQ